MIMRRAFILAALLIMLGPVTANGGWIEDYHHFQHSGEMNDMVSTENNTGWASDGYFSGSNRFSGVSGDLSFSNANYVHEDSGYKVEGSLDARGAGREFGAPGDGDMWMSYLIHMTGGEASPKVGLRTEPWSGYSAGIDGVNYSWNATEEVYEIGEASLNVGETYLAVARYTIGDPASSLTAWHFAEGDSIPTTEAGLDALTDNVFTRIDEELEYLVDGQAGAVGYMGDELNIDSFRISNSGGDTGVNNVLLNVVPEPTSLALLGIGGVAAVLRRRRRS